MEWAAPDAAPRRRRARRPGAVGGVGAEPAAAEGLPRLAPMTVSDILDGGFAILKRAPATIIGLTAVFVVPVQALGAWLNRGAEGLDFDEAFAQSDTSFQFGDSGAVSGAAVVGAPGRAR